MPGNEQIGKEELNSLLDIFKKSNGVLFAHGFEKKRNNIFRTKILENNISKFLKCKYTAVCSSGTAAGYLSLKAMGVKPGDEVITQAFTFIAAIESIIQVGAKPIIVDCDKSFNMDPNDLEKKITKKTKCIMPVHMLGEQANMESIMKVAKKYKIPVVEDACEALGAKFKNFFLGTIGDCGFFSLDFGKIITSGEGGFVSTNNKKIWEQIKASRDHGHENKKNIHRGLDKAVVTGFNYRMSELQAAVAIAQLKKIKNILNIKKRNKNIFIKELFKKNNLGKFKIRYCHDNKNEQFDHLVLVFSTIKIANNIYKKLKINKINTGILPVAMRWHYAGYWRHIWKNFSDKRIKKYRLKTWNNTWNYLNRSISIQVSTLDSKNDIIKKSKKILKIIKSSV